MIDEGDVCAVLRALRGVAGAAGVPFVLVGAYARDLRLQGAPGVDLLRRTRDVDVAVMVPDWERFERVREGLLGRLERDFAPSAAPHRILFGSRLEVDIVPFGALMDGDGAIRWPPDGSVQMSVLGFEDAYDSATDLPVGSERVRVVTLAGLALLKLMAWNDDRGRTKDAEDLAVIARRYPDVPGQEDRLWQGPDGDLVGEPGFDYELAGARLLGRDVARTIRRLPVRHAIEAILSRETAVPPYDLAAAMGRCGGGSAGKALDLLGRLRMGVLDIPAKGSDSAR